MARQGQRARHGARASTHEELPPTRRLVVIETARATVVASLLGCAVALMLDTLGMVVAVALLGDAAGTLERLGRGILAAASIGIVLLALLAGPLSTAARFALAELYTRATPSDPRLSNTLLVRGQVSRSPADPALASVIAFGGLALLAAIPCIVLATEHVGRFDDEPRRVEFMLWLIWSAALITIALLSALVTWWLIGVNRRWAAGPAARLPRAVVGYSGPAVRTTSRAQRCAARRTWGLLEWTGWVGGALVAIGAGIVFLGVFLHQPGLYATPVRFNTDVERAIAVAAAGGGVLLVVGILLSITAGCISATRTIRAVRVAAAEPTRATTADRRLVRAATTSLSESVTTAQATWAAVTVAVSGWWFAAQRDAASDAGAAALSTPGSSIGSVLLVLAWLLCGAVLIGARVTLQLKGPVLRNRFGHDLPSESDEREFLDLPRFGQ